MYCPKSDSLDEIGMSAASNAAFVTRNANERSAVCMEAVTLGYNGTRDLWISRLTKGFGTNVWFEVECDIVEMLMIDGKRVKC